MQKIVTGLKNVCGESVLSYSSVKPWVVDFKCCRSDIVDKPRSVRSSSAMTEVR